MPTHASTLWLIPLLPFAAGIVCALLPLSRRKTAFTLAVGALSGSLVLSVSLLYGLLSGGVADTTTHSFTWLTFGNVDLELGVLLNPLTALMISMVSFVSLLIFIYSHGYMHADRSYTRFFSFLALFAGGMLGLCVANSLVLLFISWEIVGLCSYLLIGFWFEKPSAAAAAKKAFLVTKIGDVGFLIGILWLYAETNSQLLVDDGAGILDAAQLTALGGVQNTFMGMSLAGVLALLIFCGAVGKSGQLPLHVWLPDAMEGPTPVSALIHAATMVAAGVFLVGRMYPLFEAEPASLAVVAWVGGLTALFGASVALAQRDIKRILAYSTVSQLGLMMLGLGAAGFGAGIFHLLTHAFFKALLFLGAGSVIHACHDEQDIWKMGGLRKAMPITFATYVIGAAALAGVFPLAGFFSKDEILGGAWNAGNVAAFAAGVVTSLLTAFYMTRQVLIVFFGAPRAGGNADRSPDESPHGSPHGSTHGSPHASPHESPPVMTAPLVILAVFAVVLGFVGARLGAFLAPQATHASVSVVFMAAMALVPIAGIAAGWLLYGKTPVASADADPLLRAQPLFGVLERRWYVDELYAATLGRALTLLGRAAVLFDAGLAAATSFFGLVTQGVSRFNRALDDFGVRGAVRAFASLILAGGRRLSRLQSGLVPDYLAAVAIGAVVLVVIAILMMGPAP